MGLKGLNKAYWQLEFLSGEVCPQTILEQACFTCRLLYMLQFNLLSHKNLNPQPKIHETLGTNQAVLAPPAPTQTCTTTPPRSQSQELTASTSNYLGRLVSHWEQYQVPSQRRDILNKVCCLDTVLHGRTTLRVCHSILINIYMYT